MSRALKRALVGLRPSGAAAAPERHGQQRGMAHLGRPLLVVHAVDDQTVEVAEGERIFAAARQPKSFVPVLDDDHLLTSRRATDDCVRDPRRVVRTDAVMDGARRRPGCQEDNEERGSRVAQAVWKGLVLAHSDDTIVVEGNHYFPPDAVRWQLMLESPTTSRCFWKGKARLDDAVDDDVHVDAAWYYPQLRPLARRIAGGVAFWRGVQVTD